MTVAPSAIVSKEASFDGNVANSGIVDAVPGEGFIVTTHWIERYDGLLGKYGPRLTPPIASGNRVGFTEKDGRIYITSEVLVRFIRLNQWRKAEQTP